MQIWNSYFVHVNATLDFLVSDNKCAKKLRAIGRRSHVYEGDEKSWQVMDTIYDNIKTHPNNGYDVIIDDGGHHMHQQKAYFEGLWNAVKPRGIYVIEDIHSSYMKELGGGPIWTERTTIALMKEYLDYLNCDTNNSRCLPGVLSIDCFRHACVLTKSA
jgi:hypothetical protein